MWAFKLRFLSSTTTSYKLQDTVVLCVPVVVKVTTLVGSLRAPVDEPLRSRKLYVAPRDTVFHVNLVVSAGCGSPSGTHCPTVLYSMKY